MTRETCQAKLEKCMICELYTPEATNKSWERESERVKSRS